MPSNFFEPDQVDIVLLQYLLNYNLHDTSPYSAYIYVRSAVNGQQNCHRLTVLTAVKPFQTFLVIRHLSEVCTLSGQGIYPYLFHYKTAFAFSEFLYPLIYGHSLRTAFHTSWIAWRQSGLPCSVDFT